MIVMPFPTTVRDPIVRIETIIEIGQRLLLPSR